MKTLLPILISVFQLFSFSAFSGTKVSELPTTAAIAPGDLVILNTNTAPGQSQSTRTTAASNIYSAFHGWGMVTTNQPNLTLGGGLTITGNAIFGIPGRELFSLANADPGLRLLLGDYGSAGNGTYIDIDDSASRINIANAALNVPDGPVKAQSFIGPISGTNLLAGTVDSNALTAATFALLTNRPAGSSVLATEAVRRLADTNDLVVIEGDSRTSSGWPDFIKTNTFFLNRTTVSNQATGGASLTTISNRFAAVAYAATQFPTSRKYFILFEGVNDVSVPGGFTDVTWPFEWCRRFSNYVAAVKASGFTVVVCTFPVTFSGGVTPGTRNYMMMRDMNELLRNTYKLGFFDLLIDLESLMTSPDDLTLWSPDLIHFNDSGHRMIANYINGCLMAWGSSFITSPKNISKPYRFIHTPSLAAAPLKYPPGQFRITGAWENPDGNTVATPVGSVYDGLQIRGYSALTYLGMTVPNGYDAFTCESTLTFKGAAGSTNMLVTVYVDSMEDYYGSAYAQTSQQTFTFTNHANSYQYLTFTNQFYQDIGRRSVMLTFYGVTNNLWLLNWVMKGN
jgi:hypothetical protein